MLKMSMSAMDSIKEQQYMIRREFAEKAKAMLEEMATHVECTCDGGRVMDAFRHAMTCPVSVTLRNARAVGMLGEPR